MKYLGLQFLSIERTSSLMRKGEGAKKAKPKTGLAHW